MSATSWKTSGKDGEAGMECGKKWKIKMKRKIRGAHPPGKIAEHDWEAMKIAEHYWEAMKNRVLDSVYQEAQSHNAPQNTVYLGTVQE